jgi:hypothetical protein
VCVKKVLKNIMLFLTLSILVFAVGCDDPATAQVIRDTAEEVIDDVANLTEPIIEGAIVEIVDNLPANLPDEEQEETENKDTQEEKPSEPKKIELDEYPELQTGEIFEYTLDDDFDYGKYKDIYEGDTHIINIDGQKHIIKLLKVTSDGKTLYEVNGRSTDFLEPEDTLRLGKAHYLEVGAGLYNGPWSAMRSLAELKFHRETLQSYPDFFVEENIGSYEFEKSERDGDDFVAYYSNNLEVRIKPNYDFLNYYKDDDNLYLFDDMDYVYRILDEDDNILEIAWFSDNITVSMNKKSDLVLERYLAKHSTDLEMELYCTREARIIEGDTTKQYYINGKNYELYFVGVDPESGESKFEIDGEFFPKGKKLPLKEREEIGPGVEIEVKKIWPDYLDGKDRIRLCFIYDDN